MKIIVNGRFLLHRITGVERYARELLLELDKIIKPGEIEIAIPPETKKVPKYSNINVTKVGKLNNILWEHISFPIYVKKNNAVSLNLCNVAPLFNPGIVCIHDMKVKAHPEYFSKKFRMWYGLLFKNATKRAKVIITVSEFSKREIMRYYNVPYSKIVVIPNAWQHYNRIAFDENTLNKFELVKDEYFFAMGSMEPNKNFRWIADTAKSMPEHIFAIAGSVNDKVFSEGLGFRCPVNMKLLGYVSDTEAKTMMRDCKAFLFPSIYEGFGIPPLEAMSAGCKRVVVSDTEVMHEIFEDCVEYIDLENLNNLTDEKHYKMNKNNILDKYSWKKSALQLKELLEK